MRINEKNRSGNLPSLLKLLWGHITGWRKKQLGLIVLLMFVVSIAEVVSIGAVIPFLAVLASPEVVFQNELVMEFSHYVGMEKASQQLLLFTVTFVIAAIVAGMLRVFLLWHRTRLGHAIGADLSFQIYQKTLYQPYLVHTRRNSSEVIAGISTKADQVVSGAIMPLLVIVSSIITIIMVVAALIMMNPKMAIGSIVGFTGVYFCFVWLTKQRLIVNSHSISKNTNLTIKSLQEGLGGIRDVLMDGAQSIYCDAYRSADLPRRRAIANNVFIAQSPRYVVEPLGMAMIAGLAYFYAGAQGNLAGALPLLGAIAIGAQRMLPVMQQAYGAWSSIRGAQAILEDAIGLLDQPFPKHLTVRSKEVMPFERSIKLQALSYSYCDGTPAVLKDLNLEIFKGTIVGIIGETGCGKSTVLDIIMSLLTPSKGALLIDGLEVCEDNIRGWQSHISHIPQAIFLADATVAENIAFGVPVEDIDYERVKKFAKLSQIDSTIESWAEQYGTRVGERGVRLSGGQRQRIGIARALYKQSDVLILDEATSALDSDTERAIMSAIDKLDKNITILIVAHRLTTLKICDYVIELEGGVVKRKGSYSEMVS
jgi:ATP-binding cassette subfamily B protein